jgi:hypothetical protein
MGSLVNPFRILSSIYLVIEMNKLAKCIIASFLLCLHMSKAATNFEYDGLGRLSRSAREGDVMTNFSHDSTGNRIRKTTRYASITIPTALPTAQYLGAIEFPFTSPVPARVLVNIGKRSAFTASLEIGGRRVQWKGVFTANSGGGGMWVGTVNDPILGLLEVRLEVPSDGGQMTVFLTQNEQTSTALLALAGQRGAGNVAASLYTVLLPANPDFPEDDFPQGDGYATLRVTAKGEARLAGKLGDGTTMTQSGPLTHDGRFQVFVPLYKKAGVLSGWVDFTPIAQISDFNGTLHWTKPESPAEAFYPAGFDLALDILGSKFASPLNGRLILNFNSTDGRSVLGFSRGNLSELILKETVLSAQNKLIISNPGAESPRLAFTNSSGLFSGSFTPPGAGKRTPFAGVVFQKQAIASGHFNGSNQTGLAIVQRDLFSSLVLPAAQTTLPDNEFLSPPTGSTLQWSDEFSESVLDTSKWGIEYAAVVALSNGYVSVTNNTNWSGWISTKDKVTFQGQKYVIEFRAKRNSQYDFFMALIDSANSANSIHVFESSHWSNVGLSLMSGGAFGASSQSSGNTTTEWKEYRLTIDGNTAVVERGNDLSNITETLTRVLSSSIADHPLSINLGAAGGNTAQIDWIRVTVE